MKRTREGSEREPETLCLQAVEVQEHNRVLFVERSGELRLLARLTSREEGSRRDTKCEEREKSVGVDPKPGDLSMSRLKFP